MVLTENRIFIHTGYLFTLGSYSHEQLVIFVVQQRVEISIFFTVVPRFPAPGEAI